MLVNDAQNEHTTTTTPMAVDQMTSREFHLDENAHLDAIKTQMKDSETMTMFKNVIMHNKHLFRGRVVVNVGCGVGLLALIAAKAGAAQVYAIDTSNVVDYARRIVQANGYSHIIHVLQGKVRDVELPITDRVDIIVSNWMGYSLLSQSICDEVLDARDKWLRPGGLIFPDVAKLFVVGLEDHQHRNELFSWWQNVYGFTMKSIANHVVSEACLQRVRHKQIITSFYRIKKLDLNTATKDDLLFREKFRVDAHRSGYVDGLVTFFHALFTKAHKPISLSTDPSERPTKWVQSVFYFKEAVYVNAKQELFGGIEMITPPGGGACNLNNIVVNMELYSCVETDLTLELEMSWRMRPNWLHEQPVDNELITEQEQTQQQQQNDNQMTVNAPMIQQVSDQPASIQPLALAQMPTQPRTACVSAENNFVATIASHCPPTHKDKNGNRACHRMNYKNNKSYNIIMGDHIYPIAARQQNHKHTKKITSTKKCATNTN